MLRTLMENVHNMAVQMGIISRMRSPRKNQKQIMEMKTIVTEMKNAFERLISRLDKAEERISALEDNVRQKLLELKEKYINSLL